MRLLRLALRNFKGLQKFVLEPNGADIAVFGDNAVGKTTLADAFMWLLFSKDSANRSDFEIKTLGPDGQPIHGLEHEVEAILDLEPGRLTLRKSYQEQWTKKRGSATKQFTGHTTDHFVDGVPATKTEFAARVASISDEAAFRLLTDPTFFNEQLHWQKRRETLLAVCGDVSDADVIAGDRALAGLPEILGNKTIEQLRKVLAARRAEINQELDRIPVRIDEARRGLPEITGDTAALKTRLDGLQAQRSQVGAERLRIQAGGEAAELTKKLRENEVAVMDLQRQYRAKADEAVKEAQLLLSDEIYEGDRRARDGHRLRNEIAQGQNDVALGEARIQKLRDQWHEVDKRELTLSIEEVCPTCGRPLPEDRVREAREKATADHNARKAAELEDLTARGKHVAESNETARRALERLEALAAEAEREAADHQTKAAELQLKINRLRSEAPAVEADPEYKRLKAEREHIEERLSSLRTGNADALAKVAETILNLDGQIAGVETALGAVDQRERGLARIKELEADERRLATEFEELERQLALTEQFIRSKVRLLTDKINAKFRLARFKLFDEQVNGALAEVCETTYNGVPYASLNHGGQMNVGLDIINTLAEHYRFLAPVWIDNAESVTSILPTRGQQIQLVVSKPDKALRVEREAKKLTEVA
ncbi:MAG: coiled-coil domain-containing protein [Bacillota bacterium]